MISMPSRLAQSLTFGPRPGPSQAQRAKCRPCRFTIKEAGNHIFAGVYDGHGGVKTSNFLQDRYYDMFQRWVPDLPS